MAFFDINKVAAYLKKEQEINENPSIVSPETLKELFDRKVEAQKWCLGFSNIGSLGAFAGNLTNLLNNRSYSNGQFTTLNPNQNIPKDTKEITSENGWKVFIFLVKNHSFPPEAAAGIIGNLMQESSVNIDPKMHQSGGPGRGIVQWTYSQRWQSLLAWARENNKNEWDLYTQLEFMIKEMRERKSKGVPLYDALRKIKDVEQATYFFEKTMEAAGIKHMEKRLAYAYSAYKTFNNLIIAGKF